VTDKNEMRVDHLGESVQSIEAESSRLIDSWFPCPEVDDAVATPAGSGRSEKALFTWFASRPIAQARAAVLCSLLTDSAENREDVRIAVRTGDRGAMARLRARVLDQFHGRPPVVLDMFSGRGIIPLEASRAGATSIGTDLSPVATLAGRLLGDYPLKDWSQMPAIPFCTAGEAERTVDDGPDVEGTRSPTLFDAKASVEPRLLQDVRCVLEEVGRRVASEVAPLYPSNPLAGGALP
jgi:adenine-specific DNA methylase